MSRQKMFQVKVPLCAIVLLAILVSIATTAAIVHAQVSDGDEQFEFQHQDIGRISGLSSGSPTVAAQTTLHSKPQQQPQQVLSVHSAEPAAAALSPAVAQVFEARGSHTGAHGTSRGGQRAAQGSQRKPNRITLVPRRDPLPSQSSQAVTQQQQPALIAAQLPAPLPQQPALFQTAPSLQLAEPPTFAPSLAPQHHHAHQHQQTAPAPTLSSSRATGGSISARHSALIAQVAAERAAAAGLGGENTALAPPSSQVNSFGSPAEAFSSPQVVAVPHQHQQSAFASFAASAQNINQQQQHQVAAPTVQVPAASAPPQHTSFVNQPEEPLVAPSFEQVLGQGCPHKGVFSWENRDHCDRYYMCTNGTFTEEACPNGLAYSQQGAVYQHCAYNWNVNCGAKKTAEPIASPGCPWQFGIFPIVQAGRCSIDYFVCEWGVPDTKRCSPEGLFYDDRIKGCQWADQLGCKSEALLNFKCPPEDEDNQFWPFPRYYHSTKDVIVCVNEQPRLVHCTDEQIVDPGSLACMEINKKKQKF